MTYELNNKYGCNQKESISAFLLKLTLHIFLQFILVSIRLSFLIENNLALKENNITYSPHENWKSDGLKWYFCLLKKKTQNGRRKASVVRQGLEDKWENGHVYTILLTIGKNLRLNLEKNVCLIISGCAGIVELWHIFLCFLEICFACLILYMHCP